MAKPREVGLSTKGPKIITAFFYVWCTFYISLSDHLIFAPKFNISVPPRPNRLSYLDFQYTKMLRISRRTTCTHFYLLSEHLIFGTKFSFVPSCALEGGPIKTFNVPKCDAEHDALLFCHFPNTRCLAQIWFSVHYSPTDGVKNVHCTPKDEQFHPRQILKNWSSHPYWFEP